MKCDDDKFYTFRGYSLLGYQLRNLTPGMEDYLEMLYRLTSGKGYVRLNDLARHLNVQPSSASKMIQKLSQHGFIKMKNTGNTLDSSRCQTRQISIGPPRTA